MSHYALTELILFVPWAIYLMHPLGKATRVVVLSSILLWGITSTVTEVFAQPNTVIPAQATTAANINGRWRGRYLCGQGYTGVTLTINQKAAEVSAEFDLYPLPENPGVPKGVALYQGVFDQASRQMLLRGVKWLKQPAPGWVIVDFFGGFDSQLRSFSGRKLNTSCKNIVLVREMETQSAALPTAEGQSRATPTAKDYEQFRGGVSVPDCDFYFDVPKFVELQRAGSLEGAIGRAIFDGERSNTLTLGVGAGGSCEIFRTSSGAIHKIRSGIRPTYNGIPIKKLLNPPNERISIFVDSNDRKHTIIYLYTPLSQIRSIEKIADGTYLYAHFRGEPDFLEIKGGDYRGLVRIPGRPVWLDGMELGPWKPISQSGLRFVRKGVIFNSSTPKTPYWCSQNAPGWQPFSRRYPILFCTADGLTSVMPDNFKGMF
jgi:hypothetical protein